MILNPRVIPGSDTSLDGYLLAEKDDDTIYEAVKVLFPMAESDDARSEFITMGFSDFSHFGVLNWYNLLSRGSHWKALNHLSYWCIDFFKCNIAHEAAQQSFMRKQTRVLWALSQGESIPMMQFMTYGGKQSDYPSEVIWGRRENVDLLEKHMDLLSKIILTDCDSDPQPKRAKS